MTSGNDKKGPPPRRPAPPPGAPTRPAGPTTGGSAARPAPRPAAPAPAAPARGPAPAPRPAPRAPVMEADADEKTSAINLADMGLEEDEATVSVSSAALKARAATRPAPDYDSDEKTTAFNVADLPPEDDAHDAKRPAQKTLLGHPAPKATGGAAVRGGAAPVRRAETQAIAPSMSRPAPKAPAPHYDDEKTSALSLDDIDKIDAAPARPAAKFAPPPQEEKTMAMSLDEINKIDVRPTPQKGQKGAPTHLGQDEKTMAVSLDDIDKIDAAPRRAAARVQEVAQDEKTTAMSLDDIDKIDAAPRPATFSKRADAPKAQAPQRARAGAPAQTPDGFLGNIAYLFQADARKARGEAVDDGKKAAGLRNLIAVGGAAAVLMVVIGFIF